MKLSANLTLKEATKSNTAIKNGIHNIPGDRDLAALQNIAKKVFQPVRNHFNYPIKVTSGYRSSELNKKIGGSNTSQHCKGEALDMDADYFGGMTNCEIFNYIKNKLDFDQLIWEFGTDAEPDWVHVSLKYKGIQRKEVLKASRRNGKTIYERIL